MQDDLFQTAISSQRDIPVSHSPLLGSSEAQKMTAISGQKYLPLCKPSDQIGAFSRMFLATLPWASTKCYLTWKVKATPSSHLLFQLAPLMPRTDATESGLWPTATTQDNPQVRGQGKAIGNKRGTTLGGAVRMWATPTAANAVGTSRPPSKGGGSRDLRQDVRMWPTPTANEDAAGTPNGKMQRQLGNHPDIRGTTPEEWKRGSLNPQWVEWLMGYPEGWTDLKG